MVSSHIKTYRANRDTAHSVLNALDGVSVNLSRGTSYLFPDVRGIGRDDQFIAAELRKAGLIVNPGFQFGLRGLGHIRICVAQTPEVWDRALSMLCATLERLRDDEPERRP
jgi:aspartate/methionine/tyrosine aminotransferase